MPDARLGRARLANIGYEYPQRFATLTMGELALLIAFKQDTHGISTEEALEMVKRSPVVTAGVLRLPENCE